jgi:hypothetical protein
MSQLNRIHMFVPYFFFTLHFNVSLPSTRYICPCRFFSSDFPIKFFTHFSRLFSALLLDIRSAFVGEWQFLDNVQIVICLHF